MFLSRKSVESNNDGKEIQRKKKVLIDLTNYGSLTAGFGQIAANYAAAFSSMPIEDLHLYIC